MNEEKTNNGYSQAYEEEECRLRTVSCCELGDLRFKRLNWLVEGLLKPGLAVLAGAPKIGKSWMVLQLCMAMAKGEPFLGLPTHPCTTLYIALEDSLARIQDRVLHITDDLPEKLHFTVRCSEMGDRLVREIQNFVCEHKDTKLVVIDTFQKIRTMNTQTSYANDYLETSAIKCLADTLDICILLVHHTRKMGDSDCVNEISGTNGIAGSADNLMVLKKEKRTDRNATLSATGRDIEDRLMELKLNGDSCRWEVVSDTVGVAEAVELPEVLTDLVGYIKYIGTFEGGNSLFCDGFSAFCKKNVNIKALKYLMTRYRYELEDRGVLFKNYRTSGMRMILISYLIDYDIYADRSAWMQKKDGRPPSEDCCEEGYRTQ